jgi:5'-deoxynucleotidase YfbR-like HD superfamily hydrolase
MDTKNLLDFHTKINKLKQTKRYSAATDKSVQDSTAEHSWALAFLVLDCIQKLKLTDIDPVYSVKIALVHDLGEYKMDSDIDCIEVARGNVSKQDKYDEELKSIKDLTKEFGREDIFKIWDDYEKGTTLEARYVKGLDKIEALKHLIERDATGRTEEERDHVAFCADKAILAFPRLNPLLKEVKLKLKEFYKKRAFEWKAEYDKV